MHNLHQAACGLGLALLAGCASIGTGAEEPATVATAPASAPAASGGGEILAGVNPTPGAGPPEKSENGGAVSPEKEKQQSAGAFLGSIFKGVLVAAIYAVAIAAGVVLAVAGGLR